MCVVLQDAVSGGAQGRLQVGRRHLVADSGQVSGGDCGRKCRGRQGEDGEEEGGVEDGWDSERMNKL